MNRNPTAASRELSSPDLLRAASLGGSRVKNVPAMQEDVGLIPGLGRSPGEENDVPLQHSPLGNPMERGA